MGEKLGERLGMKEELIIKACSMSMEIQNSSEEKQYVYEKLEGSLNEVVFAFHGLRSVADWKPFGETEIGRTLFPSIRSIGVDQVAMVNKALLLRFDATVLKPKFVAEVEKSMKKSNQIVFAGHSSGGGVAILITIWFLEKYIRTGLYEKPPRCLTFGSPLIGDMIISHALRREGWARYFINFVTRYDIVPRIMLTPLSTIEEKLGLILPLKNEPVQKSNEVSELFNIVMNNALYVASHSACNLMECTNPILDNFSMFAPLSPYRPFGTYIFSTGNGRLAVVENPNAVLQMLFYCGQISKEEECEEIACRSINEHMMYETVLKSSIQQDVVYLNQLEKIPLSSNDNASHDPEGTNTILNDFCLSTRGRLCLRAAGEFEKQKLEQEKIIDSYKDSIRERLRKTEKYKMWCESRGVTYCDSFKLHNHTKDFKISATRPWVWVEITEKLKRYELPDEFEGREEWIMLATEYQRLYEPLSISNFYRHCMYRDSGHYMGGRGRPKRYKYIQRWREHSLNMEVGSSCGSCFLARVEQLIVRGGEGGESYDNLKEDILKLERDAFIWVGNGELGKDVFIMEGSTFSGWWKSLPDDHRRESCLKDFIN